MYRCRSARNRDPLAPGRLAAIPEVQVKDWAPRIPAALRDLIRQISDENPVWGEERTANELLLKLGLRVSPRTVRKYMPKRPPGPPRGGQRWATFLLNHAEAILACDFFVTVTATFRLLYVFIVIYHGSRRLLHINVTTHPTATWTLHQLREAFGFDTHQFLLHDRDSIFTRHLDESIEGFGLQILKSPPHSPNAYALCERLIGTIRREFLDWLIPLSEPHLRAILCLWSDHYNRARPHVSLGPSMPGPPRTHPPASETVCRHRIDAVCSVAVRSVLGGLHLEYSLQAAWANFCAR